MDRMDVTDVSTEEIAKMFVECINHEKLQVLIDTYKDDISSDQKSNIVIGKFRLIHIVDPATNTYLTFTANFYDDTFKRLAIHNIEKNAIVLDGNYDPAIPSWTSNTYYESIPVSSIIDMAQRLKSILN